MSFFLERNEHRCHTSGAFEERGGDTSACMVLARWFGMLNMVLTHWAFFEVSVHGGDMSSM